MSPSLALRLGSGRRERQRTGRRDFFLFPDEKLTRSPFGYSSELQLPAILLQPVARSHPALPRGPVHLDGQSRHQPQSGGGLVRSVPTALLSQRSAQDLDR